jgi:hypothetical protein
VSEASEKPCPCCGGRASNLMAVGVIRCDGCHLEIRRTTYEEAWDAWNRRSFPHPIGYALADYLHTGNIQALMMVLDEEWGARERAKGELDRALTSGDFLGHGFESIGVDSYLAYVGASYPIQIARFHQDGYWSWCAGDNRIIGVLKTIRQFIALCTLFGISPSP